MSERSGLHQRVVDRIHRHGPLRFSAVIDAALYDPEAGFFAAGTGAPGRRGDFITSPEVGPLFGAVVANALDAWWDELGQPDPFVVVDAGAGVGTLAVTVLAAAPRCAGALRYVLVEASPVLREHHGDHLPLAPPATGLGLPGAGDGPVIVSLGEMPATRFTGVIIANELLDNLPFDLLQRTEQGWAEVRVGIDSHSGSTTDPESGPWPVSPRLVRHRLPASEVATAAAERFAPAAPVGATIPWQRTAGEWVRGAVDLLERGRLVVIDYAVESTAELAERPETDWLRTYRRHERAGDPLADLGSSDITVEVCLDQVGSLVGPPAAVETQADFLRNHGIEALVDEGRRVWNERAHLGDLAAIKGRSRVTEAEALLDPEGLGAFRVSHWKA